MHMKTMVVSQHTTAETCIATLFKMIKSVLISQIQSPYV